MTLCYAVIPECNTILITVSIDLFQRSIYWLCFLTLFEIVEEIRKHMQTVEQTNIELLLKVYFIGISEIHHRLHYKKMTKREKMSSSAIFPFYVFHVSHWENVDFVSMRINSIYILHYVSHSKVEQEMFYAVYLSFGYGCFEHIPWVISFDILCIHATL